MSTNKHATIRYHALDRCFSNRQRRFYINDLINACNEALFDYTGHSDGIGRRQIFEDIKFMESDQGWSISLERHKDGKKVYYRYTDPGYSIKKQSVNELEAKQLRETLSILTRFKGMPQFDWVEEILVRFESAFNLKGNAKMVVGFEQNPYLKGLNHFNDLFSAIQYKKVLNVTYQGFKMSTPTKLTIHPYFLKQYNNRWFLFGRSDEYHSISNMALDRILAVTDNNAIQYEENTLINFEEYFDDVVGVTVKPDGKAERLLLEIELALWSYIESKPLHGSQKVIAKNERSVTIELIVQINYEITTAILAFGAEIKVLEPEHFKNKIMQAAQAICEKYS